jgi:hypothetical protein
VFPSLVKAFEQSLIRVAPAKLQYVYVVTSSVHALNLLEHGSQASRVRICAFEFDATSHKMFAFDSEFGSGEPFLSSTWALRIARGRLAA